MRIARLALFSILLGTGASDSTLSGTQGRDDLSPALLDRPVCPHIGSRLEIFVDYFLLDRLQGTRLKLHHPRPAEVAVRKDRTWEGEHGFGQDVILGGDTYLMYYHSGNRFGRTNPSGASSRRQSGGSETPYKARSRLSSAFSSAVIRSEPSRAYRLCNSCGSASRSNSSHSSLS